VKAFVSSIQNFALAWGGPGLLLVGFLDSSFLSFPMINDLLLIGMVTRNKSLVAYYVAMATAGSVLGCLSLYYVGRKGGEAFLRKRFKASYIERGTRLLQKYGLLVVMVAAMLPPPAPFKIFVLLAGVAAIPAWQFGSAILIARSVRYTLEGVLAVYYGEAAGGFLKAHAREAGLVLATVALAGGLGWIAWQRRRARP
jgi:membrane protein YqaA with SNARE-associated domain